MTTTQPTWLNDYDALSGEYSKLTHAERETVHDWFVRTYELYFGERGGPVKFERVMVVLGSIVNSPTSDDDDKATATSKIDELAGVYAAAVELEIAAD